MSEEALRELLRSPLDDPQPRRSRPLRLAGIGMLALAVGGGAAFGGSALLADEELPAPASTTVTTTTVPADTRVQAAEGVGLEASWIYDAGDDLYVGLSTVVDPGTDRTTADGIQTGWWRLRVAGPTEGSSTSPPSSQHQPLRECSPWSSRASGSTPMISKRWSCSR
jgi:hypothetical protein